MANKSSCTDWMYSLHTLRGTQPTRISVGLNSLGARYTLPTSTKWGFSPSCRRLCRKLRRLHGLPNRFYPKSLRLFHDACLLPPISFSSPSANLFLKENMSSKIGLFLSFSLILIWGVRLPVVRFSLSLVLYLFLFYQFPSKAGFTFPNHSDFLASSCRHTTTFY